MVTNDTGEDAGLIESVVVSAIRDTCVIQQIVGHLALDA